MVYMWMMGVRVKREEDPRLITGGSTYVDDVQPQNLGHVAILRSIYGHARINGIDTSAAKALPGVLAVYTGAEFQQFTGPMPHGGGEGGGGPKGMVGIDTYPIEPEVVRHVGQAIAVVVAKYASACNLGYGNIELIRQKLPILRQHCESLGRDYDAITKSTSLNVHILD